ncbi:hypothetical protein [uncultured Pseudacidovorax sp.]|uniref:hypothetical protein n=1 Tax=uncultured Pseudacidovorax sp. TaxID=679313 RepID=UPI0025F3F8C6|nr:hypothetical protein [uncultured Pseudacidovorax sp.]
MSNFRMRGSLRRTTLLARQGVVTGGAYDGWRYTFSHFSYANRRVYLHLVLNEPGWPFPIERALRPLEFSKLVPVPGERSPRIDTRPLIDQAKGVTP